MDMQTHKHDEHQKGGQAGHVHGHHQHGARHEPGQGTPAPADEAPPPGTIYTCPMHPEVRQDHPATAPSAA